MKKPDIEEIPESFRAYVSLVDDIELSESFDKSIKQIDELDIPKLKRIGLKTYADGKWSVNKIIHHLTDWERIFCYRTILSARNEGTVPQGHEENIMADNSNADELPIEQLIAELRAVRLATIAMFNTFNNRLLLTDCKFSQYHMSILAMGYNIIGHQMHHFMVIKERYLPLDN